MSEWGAGVLEAIATRKAAHVFTEAIDLFLDGFRSLRMPSMTPLASLYAGIPVCGILVALFTVEQLVNGWRNGFAEPGIP